MSIDVSQASEQLKQAKKDQQQLAFAFWQQTNRAGRQAEPHRQESQQEKPTEADRRQLSL